MKYQKLTLAAFGILVLSMVVLGSFSVDTTATSSSRMNEISRGVDAIVGVDAYNSYTASTSATLLNAPASGYGNIYYRGDDYDQYKVPVSAGEEVSVRFQWSGSYSGIDIYYYNVARTRVYLGSNLVDFTYNFAAASSSGYVYFALDADKTYDRGDYYLTVTKSGAPAPDTQAPTCTITFPTEGATVSGTITVTATASDNVGVSYVECGTTKDYTAPYQWTIDTTAYADGSYTVTCTAYDAAGNSGSDTNGFTIDNSVSPPPTDDGGLLTAGVTAYGHMDQADGADMFWIDIGANAASMRVVLECGSSDFDTYGKFGSEPTTSSYDWRGYTSGGEDNTVSTPAQGRHYIMVDWYSGEDDYSLLVTVTYNEPLSWGNGGKYAVIVGISNYASISDLSYCDEDANDWYAQLNALGYECKVFGDHTSNYARYDGLATEANVRNAITSLAAHAQAGDQVVFITSGHGSGDGNGNSFLCMHDCSGSVGCYYDYELAADMDNFALGVDIFIFIDHCYSGGMGPELMSMPNSQYVYVATTCTEDGYGWDDPTHLNGMWTYYFLDYSWQSHFGNNPGQSMETIFDYALANYPKSGGDTPQEFDGNTGSYFTLN